MTEQQWGKSMKETAESLARVLTDIEVYGHRYGQYMDLADSAISFKWEAKPMIVKLKRLAEYAEKEKLVVDDGWAMGD